MAQVEDDFDDLGPAPAPAPAPSAPAPVVAPPADKATKDAAKTPAPTNAPKTDDKPTAPKPAEDSKAEKSDKQLPKPHDRIQFNVRVLSSFDSMLNGVRISFKAGSLIKAGSMSNAKLDTLIGRGLQAKKE